VIGAAIIAIEVFAAVTAPVLAPFDPNELHPDDSLQGPSWTYPFGTDQYGRDILSRVMYGGRTTLLIASVATLVGVLVGAGVGLISAYFRGWRDEMLMRSADVLLAFPSLLLALIILGMAGPGIATLILTIGILFAPLVARVVRSVALGIREHDYVKAARLRGESSHYIMRREMLPGIRGPLVVEGTIRFGYAILIIGTLGFLGIGVQPPSPDWGSAVAEGRSFLVTAPWVVIFPSLAIAGAVVGANLLADGIHRRSGSRGSLPGFESVDAHERVLGEPKA
jgi:peptide/nickel transport system permease protein